MAKQLRVDADVMAALLEDYLWMNSALPQFKPVTSTEQLFKLREQLQRARFTEDIKVSGLDTEVNRPVITGD